MTLEFNAVCRAGLDVRCEECQRFFRDGLTISFSKILTDEAVSGWKFEIHVSLLGHVCWLDEVLDISGSVVSVLSEVYHK